MMMITTAMQKQIAQTLMAPSHVLANLDTMEMGSKYVQVIHFYHIYASFAKEVKGSGSILNFNRMRHNLSFFPEGYLDLLFPARGELAPLPKIH